jgi:hypothetical protein
MLNFYVCECIGHAGLCKFLVEKRGIPFDQLLTIPEQDEWAYSDGKSTTCVAFILSM